MKNINETADVVIAGGGTAGHVAALQAARAGIKTTVIDTSTKKGRNLSLLMTPVAQASALEVRRSLYTLLENESLSSKSWLHYDDPNFSIQPR